MPDSFSMSRELILCSFFLIENNTHILPAVRSSLYQTSKPSFNSIKQPIMPVMPANSTAYVKPDKSFFHSIEPQVFLDHRRTFSTYKILMKYSLQLYAETNSCLHCDNVDLYCLKITDMLEIQETASGFLIFYRPTLSQIALFPVL